MKTKLYLRVYAEDVNRPGDIGGSLSTPEGEVLASHLSSSIHFLRTDLTTQFRHHREMLEERFPDGYEVIEVPNGIALADEVDERIEHRDALRRDDR